MREQVDQCFRWLLAMAISRLARLRCLLGISQSEYDHDNMNAGVFFKGYIFNFDAWPRWPLQARTLVQPRPGR